MRHKTAEFIEEQKAAATLIRKRKPRGKPFEKGNKIGPRFKPGESGNPSGKPGCDLAALAARRAFERAGKGNMPDIPKNFNAYAFSVLADRAYGKVKEVKEITGADGGPLLVKIEFK